MKKSDYKPEEVSGNGRVDLAPLILVDIAG